MAKRPRLVSVKIASGIPMGPRGDDDSHEKTFSEIGPPETMTVSDHRPILYDAHGRPLTRRVGF